MDRNLMELPQTVSGLVDLIIAATDALADAPLTAESDGAVVTLVDQLEVARRKGERAAARLLIEVSDRNAYQLAGYMSLHQFLVNGLRLGTAESGRRRTVAKETGDLRNLQGEVLPPRLPATAEALSEGAISAHHADVIARFMAKIPAAVSDGDRALAELSLAEAARTLNPDDLPKVGNRILDYLDPDGRLTDDVDRARTRSFRLLPQDHQLMTRVCALLTPEARAKLETVLTVWAAPGMNNPADPESPGGGADRPDLDPAVLEAAAGRDDRTQGQRDHDALVAMLDYLLGHQALGKPDRIPAELVITTTLAELEARSGVAITATGTRLPVADIVDLAADATPWLEVFANSSASILHFARGRRLATKTQRLALFGRDRGCTGPRCNVPFARTQAHHMPAWSDGGVTDVDRIGAACGGHNRREGHGPGQWESTILPGGPAAGRVAWRPAGTDAPWQVNPLHHPERLLAPELSGLPNGRRERSVVERLLARHVRRLRPIPAGTQIVLYRRE